jgi:hypothetical protein
VNPPPEILAQHHDESLIDWLLSLDPAQRLADLESRLEFFRSVKAHGDAELPPHTRTP